jgi:hypothetical protein
MRTQITETKLYRFDELSDAAKQKAIEREGEAQGELFDAAHDGSYDDFDAIAKILGIEFDSKPVKLMNGNTRYDPAIYYSGFWSQGDGACFEGRYEYKPGASKAIRAYAPQDTKLHGFADELARIQRPFFFKLRARMKHSGHYYHSGCMTVDVDHAWDDYYSDKRNPFEDKSLPEDEITEVMRNFADWMYRSLETEYEYRTGEECAREYLEGNTDLEFEEDGTLA